MMTCLKITESQNGQIYPEDTFSHGAAHIYIYIYIYICVCVCFEFITLDPSAYILVKRSNRHVCF